MTAASPPRRRPPGFGPQRLVALRRMYQKSPRSKIVETARSARGGTIGTSALSPGTIVGGYAVVRTIGIGGLGVVYEARHQWLDKPVAVKALQSDLADPNAVERFLREGRTAAKLRHPNVVDVSDVTLDGDIPYLVMELLEGEDLAALIAREGLLSPETTIDLLVPIVSALTLAHECNIIHRDLKPRNIFLNRSSLGTITPKVVDFGVSKVTDESVSDLTGSNAFVGTPHYTSPEQARGDKQVDHRCDQFSLGVIAYECLTGWRPFTGNSLFTVLSSVINYEPPSVHTLIPEVPQELAKVVMKLMAKQSANRFDDMRAVGQALLPFATSRIRLAYEHEFPRTTPLPCPTDTSRLRRVSPRLSSTIALSGLNSLRRPLKLAERVPWSTHSSLRGSVKLVLFALTATLGLTGEVSTRSPVPGMPMPSASSDGQRPTMSPQRLAVGVVEEPSSAPEPSVSGGTELSDGRASLAVWTANSLHSERPRLPRDRPIRSPKKARNGSSEIDNPISTAAYVSSSRITTATEPGPKSSPLTDGALPERGVNGAPILR